MRLILTRHAKSSWDQPFLSDHDRPLSKRGRRGSDLIGNWLNKNGYIPKLVLCSTSARTQETWDRIKQFMPDLCVLQLVPELYHGYHDTMHSQLTKANDSPLMILGHNPGIAYFAESIVSSVPPHPHFFRYPTAATLICDFNADQWINVQKKSGEVVDFVVPRDLE